MCPSRKHLTFLRCENLPLFNQTHKSFGISFLEARDLKVIVLVNGHDDPSSNLGPGCLNLM